MYPELYPELAGKSRRLKGFALSLAGSFVFMVTTVQNAHAFEQSLRNHIAKSTS